MGPRPIPGPTIALYSDVVASRTPSPRVGAEAQLLAISPEDIDNERVPGQLTDRDLAHISTEQNNNSTENPTSSEITNLPKDLEDGQWTTVRRRRARSLNSLERGPQVNRDIGRGNQTFTKEQVQVVQAAANELTNAQRQKYQRRHKIVARRSNSSSSRGEGPSEPKGKGIDPREWGNVEMSSDKIEVEAQKAAFNSLSKKKRKSTHEREKRSSRPKTYRPTAEHMNRVIRPAESHPVAQIAKDSYLGAALRNVESHKKRKRHRLSSPQSSDPDATSSDSETSPSGSSPDSNSWSSSQSEDAQHYRRRGNKHGRNRPRRHVSSRSSNSSRSNIKPIPPLEYDGKADAHAYHRFVRESEAYLRDGRVRGRRKVFLLSYYLTGRAYDFYTQKVSNNEEQWDLREFYNELFNYCFPVDYRMQIRRTLSRCHQNERSVAEFTHELSELFNMISDVPVRDKVLKFWNGA